MIHFSTIFYCTSLDLLLSIFLHFCCFRNIYSSSSSFHILPKHLHFFHHALKTFTTMHAHVPETEKIVSVASNLTKVHSLEAAIFHTMAYKLSLEINKNKITPKTSLLFSKFCTTSLKSRNKNHLRTILSYLCSWPKSRRNLRNCI